MQTLWTMTCQITVDTSERERHVPNVLCHRAFSTLDISIRKTNLVFGFRFPVIVTKMQFLESACNSLASFFQEDDLGRAKLNSKMWRMSAQIFLPNWKPLWQKDNSRVAQLCQHKLQNVISKKMTISCLPMNEVKGSDQILMCRLRLEKTIWSVCKWQHASIVLASICRVSYKVWRQVTENQVTCVHMNVQPYKLTHLESTLVHCSHRKSFKCRQSIELGASKAERNANFLCQKWTTLLTWTKIHWNLVQQSFFCWFRWQVSKCTFSAVGYQQVPQSLLTSMLVRQVPVNKC